MVNKVFKEEVVKVVKFVVFVKEIFKLVLFIVVVVEKVEVLVIVIDVVEKLKLFCMGEECCFIVNSIFFCWMNV